ncbi:hypothetical protein JCM33374_g2294 [Metschnikowia sp. JCM 33374]|nr:hypothetical protein JCM33374_g2294 [Metschnikowia sp. JCM 33374]
MGLEKRPSSPDGQAAVEKISLNEDKPSSDIDTQADIFAEDLKGPEETATPQGNTYADITIQKCLQEDVMLKAFVVSVDTERFHTLFPEVSGYIKRFKLGNQKLAKSLTSTFPSL